MRRKVILDAGPLVAAVDRGDRFHNWVTKEWANIEQPLFTCESVITEACFLLRNIYGGQAAIISLVSRGVIQIPFSLSQEIDVIDELMKRYRSVPMSLADACLVRMAELYSESELLTIDSDFNIYRKHKNQLLAVIMPENL